MNSPLNDEASLQIKQEDNVFNIKQIILNLKQLKSFEILKSALQIFTSNTNFMLSIILSILPLYTFMVFFEIKLQKSLLYIASNPLTDFQIAADVIAYHDDKSDEMERTEFLLDILQLSIFYLFIYPLLEFLSMILTMKFAEKQASYSPYEVLQQDINLKGPFFTYLYVHLLSTMTLLGLVWISSNHFLISSKFDFNESIDFLLILLSVAVHSVIFLGLLYKYLDWSALWNMGVVISVMEEETGVAALRMSDYYGKHCKKTGFEIMLVVFVFGNGLRVTCLYAGLCNGSVGGVLITCIVIMFVALGNLVKWVASLLYFDYCKQQTMEKKVDDQEFGKTSNAADRS